MGKGSKRRPTDEDRYRRNYDNINWNDTKDEKDEELTDGNETIGTPSEHDT